MEKKLTLYATTINLKYLHQHGIMNLIYMMDLILILIFKIILNISSKNMKLWQIIYVNKIKNRIVFKIKTSYKLELLTEETMQLLGSSKNVIDKNKDGEIVPRLETV